MGQDDEALEAYWGMDQSLLKQLNPDVNGNGIYDADESFDWELKADFTFFVDMEALYAAENGTPLDASWVDQNGMIIYRRIVDPVDTANWDDVRLYLPDAAPVEYVSAQVFPEDPGEHDYPYFNFVFDYAVLGSSGDLLRVDGRYVVAADGVIRDVAGNQYQMNAQVDLPLVVK